MQFLKKVGTFLSAESCNFTIFGKMPFYAVAKGRSVGIYDTWSECETNVKGYAGARYKKFNTRTEAAEFVKQFSGTASKGSSSQSFMLTQKRKYDVESIPSIKRTKLIDFSDSFKTDNEGFVHVYTDGACSANGRNGAKAGIGVYFGENHTLNVSEPVSGRATNNCGEIQAATKAIKKAHSAGIKKLCINTDSQFLINSVTKWINGWKRNNWQLKSGGPVKNKEDFVELDSAQKLLQIKWNYVAAHNGILGNERADKLAKAGAEMYSS